jgi:hypothetical protein
MLRGNLRFRRSAARALACAAETPAPTTVRPVPVLPGIGIVCVPKLLLCSFSFSVSVALFFLGYLGQSSHLRCRHVAQVRLAPKVVPQRWQVRWMRMRIGFSTLLPSPTGVSHFVGSRSRVMSYLEASCWTRETSAEDERKRGGGTGMDVGRVDSGSVSTSRGMGLLGSVVSSCSESLSGKKRHILECRRRGRWCWSCLSTILCDGGRSHRHRGCRCSL